MPSAAQTVLPTLPLQIRRHRRAVRSQRSILLAILEACRTPTVQHWIMVKARLGYDTFWKHMNMLVSKGMMDTSNDGYKTLYYVNQKGIEYLRTLESIRE
jgi:predicted transcriptional regulator